MAVFIEGRHTAEFLKSEAQGYRSRDNITIAAGSGILQPGTVLGRIIGAVTAAARAGNTGNGVCTVASPARTAGVRSGVYRVVFIEPATNLGTFMVEDPDGVAIGTGNVGVLFSNQVRFTIADGATDFVAGDGFDITVAAGSNKFAPTDLAAVDGSSIASRILYHRVDATSVDVPAASIARSAEVYASRLIFHSSVDQPAEVAAKLAELATSGIIAR